GRRGRAPREAPPRSRNGPAWAPPTGGDARRRRSLLGSRSPRDGAAIVSASIPSPPVTVASPPRPAEIPTRTPRPALEAAMLGAVAVALVVFFLGLYPLRGFRLAVGSDAPVYLWWSRLAARQGLSAVGARSGLPALALMLSSVLHVPLMQVLGGLGAALGTGVGLAAAGLVRAGIRGWNPSRSATAASALAGILAGTFSVHLVEGYFATLAFVVVFLAALAALAVGTRTGAAGAAGLLG